MTRLLLVIPAFWLMACEVNVATPPEVVYLDMPDAQGLDLPFSSAVRVDNMLYLSGAIGNIPGTMKLADGGIEGETRQAMDNISAALNEFGSSLDRVVKCTLFLADIADWGAANEVYKTYFETPPARSALGANGLAVGARIEIECLAVVDG